MAFKELWLFKPNCLELTITESFKYLIAKLQK